MTTSRALKVAFFSLLFTFFSSSFSKTTEVKSPFFSAPSSMNNIQLFHNEDGFYVVQSNETYFVEKCWVDSSLQDISSDDLKDFLVTGYISVNQMDNGEFSLQVKNLIKGGGFIAGSIAYWGTKALCYGAALAGAGSVVAGTGGAAGVALAGGTAVATGGVGAGTAFVGAVIAKLGLGTKAAMLTTSVITSTGSVAGAVAAVETASAAAGVFFTGLWFLP